jgi:hypothetical protein
MVLRVAAWINDKFSPSSHPGCISMKLGATVLYCRRDARQVHTVVIHVFEIFLFPVLENILKMATATSPVYHK